MVQIPMPSFKAILQRLSHANTSVVIVDDITDGLVMEYESRAVGCCMFWYVLFEFLLYHPLTTYRRVISGHDAEVPSRQQPSAVYFLISFKYCNAKNTRYEDGDRCSMALLIQGLGSLFET